MVAGWRKADGSGFCDIGTEPEPRHHLDCNRVCDMGCGCGADGICAQDCTAADCRCLDGCRSRAVARTASRCPPPGVGAELSLIDDEVDGREAEPEGVLGFPSAEPSRVPVHLANFALPADRGDDGSGAVEIVDRGRSRWSCPRWTGSWAGPPSAEHHRAWHAGHHVVVRASSTRRRRVEPQRSHGSPARP